MDTGQPVPEPVSVGLSCGARILQAIYTDPKGYFEFALGGGPQPDVDTSASEGEPAQSVTGIGLGGQLGGPRVATGDRANRLVGCELQISIGGYAPLRKTITDSGDISGIDAGILELHRLAGVEGTSISVTSLQVPPNARKEFDKAASDLHNEHVASATQHLEKAVSIYDKYAAAWNQLGIIYSSAHENDKATQAFSKAIASDPQYTLPYVGLAALQLQNANYNEAADNAGKALALDPRIGLANFIEAASDVQLHRLGDAERSGRAAEQQPHQGYPQLHVVLAQVFIQKQDYTDAAAEMRAYLKEAPQGNFAPEIKKGLDEIESSTASANAGAGSNASTAPPLIAP